MRASTTLLQKPESFFDSLKEEKSKMSVGSTAKKKGSAQKILRKNIPSTSQSQSQSQSQSAKKEASQSKLKAKMNKTHRVQVSTLDMGSQIGSMKSLEEDILSGEASPLLEDVTTQENQVEAKTPSSLRPTRSMTSLKANQKRVQTPTQQLQSQPLPKPQLQSKSQRITPQTSLRKVTSSRSRVDIDSNNNTKGGYSNIINTPSMSTDRLSPRTMFSTQTQYQSQSQIEQPKINPLALKTTYFRPIEDIKLTEYIQSIRSSQKQLHKFEYKSTDCLLEDNEAADQQQREKPQTGFTSFSTTLQSTPDAVMMTERNALINQDINIEKRSETLPEQLTTRFESAYRSNMKESPTRFSKNSQKPESSLNYMVQTARERTNKRKDSDQYRDRKHEKYYEKPRDNHIKSARYNLSDENAMFSNESLTIKGLQRSVVTRGPGDKLSPTSVIIGNTGGETNNFSKLDQLLKNFKDKDKAKNEKDLAKNLEGDGLFAPNLTGADEEPSAILSNLRKSLAKILIVKNENL